MFAVWQCDCVNTMRRYSVSLAVANLCCLNIFCIYVPLIAGVITVWQVRVQSTAWSTLSIWSVSVNSVMAASTSRSGTYFGAIVTSTISTCSFRRRWHSLTTGDSFLMTKNSLKYMPRNYFWIIYDSRLFKSNKKVTTYKVMNDLQHIKEVSVQEGNAVKSLCSTN